MQCAILGCHIRAVECNKDNKICNRGSDKQYSNIHREALTMIGDIDLALDLAIQTLFLIKAIICSVLHEYVKNMGLFQHMVFCAIFFTHAHINKTTVIKTSFSGHC